MSSSSSAAAAAAAAVGGAGAPPPVRYYGSVPGVVGAAAVTAETALLLFAALCNIDGDTITADRPTVRPQTPSSITPNAAWGVIQMLQKNGSDADIDSEALFRFACMLPQITIEDKKVRTPLSSTRSAKRPLNRVAGTVSEGSFGTVFFSATTHIVYKEISIDLVDVKPKNKVAVTVKFLRQFFTEAWIQTILTLEANAETGTKGVCKLLGIFRGDDVRHASLTPEKCEGPYTFFVVMEKMDDAFAPYLTLQVGGGLIPAPFLVSPLCEVAETLTHLRGKYGFAHRDLHAGNIMVSKGQIKLIDFGNSCITLEGKTYSLPFEGLEDMYYVTKADCVSFDMHLLLASILGKFKLTRHAISFLKWLMGVDSSLLNRLLDKEEFKYAFYPRQIEMALESAAPAAAAAAAASAESPPAQLARALVPYGTTMQDSMQRHLTRIRSTLTQFQVRLPEELQTTNATSGTPGKKSRVDDASASPSIDDLLRVTLQTLLAKKGPERALLAMDALMDTILTKMSSTTPNRPRRSTRRNKRKRLSRRTRQSRRRRST